MAYIIGDLETSGLDERSCRILEFGYQIREKLTDFNPDDFVDSFLIRYTAHQLATLFDLADTYVQAMHTGNGLWEALSDPTLSTIELADLDEHLDFEMSLWGDGPHYFVGNSIRLDRAFIEQYLPKFAAHLHYRQIDVSSTELMLEAKGKSSNQIKGNGHRVVGDVKATIKQVNAQLAML